jgi:phosphoglycerate dehydrogenase-like enzyme
MTEPEVVVLREGVHGMSTAEYAAALRERIDGGVRLARTPTEERDLVAEAPVVTGTTIDEKLLERAGDLRLFACAYAGTDHLPLDVLEERAVAVTTASGVHGPNVAEHVVGSMLVFARRLQEGWRRQRRREWRAYRSRELVDSTVTIVGLGAIGQAIVERLAGFGVETLGIRYSPEKGGPTDEVLGFEALHASLARTEYLVLACPLTEATRGLIDTVAFETVPSEAVLINVARGPVVETDALVAALRSNAIRGAALDVTDPEPLPQDHPLWGFENVLLTPHSAGHTPHYYDRLADVLATNLGRVAEAGEYEGLENQVL